MIARFLEYELDLIRPALPRGGFDFRKFIESLGLEDEVNGCHERILIAIRSSA
jgi:hypothetical protein